MKKSILGIAIVLFVALFTFVGCEKDKSAEVLSTYEEFLKSNDGAGVFEEISMHLFSLQGEDKKITKEDAIVAKMGSLECSNERCINKMIVNQVLPTCQLQMGMTELMTGSVWNTMPAHTHDRRMEAYFYFEIPEGQSACHFMGEPQDTRHIWMQNNEAVLSPEWSIHSAAATHNYTFIWGKGGENLDYGDQDFYKITELK